MVNNSKISIDSKEEDDKNEKEKGTGEKDRSVYTTRSGRSVSLPIRYVHDLGALTLTRAEYDYQINLRETTMHNIEMMNNLKRNWSVLVLELLINLSTYLN